MPYQRTVYILYHELLKPRACVEQVCFFCHFFVYGFAAGIGYDFVPLLRKTIDDLIYRTRVVAVVLYGFVDSHKPLAAGVVYIFGGLECVYPVAYVFFGSVAGVALNLGVNAFDFFGEAAELKPKVWVCGEAGGVGLFWRLSPILRAMVVSVVILGYCCLGWSLNWFKLGCGCCVVAWIVCIFENGGAVSKVEGFYSFFYQLF
jgi:hypothetical protein